MILWGGFCSVHQFFQPEQIDAFLERYPETKVIASAAELI
jgi:quinolinate synthase